MDLGVMDFQQRIPFTSNQPKLNLTLNPPDHSLDYVYSGILQFKPKTALCEYISNNVLYLSLVCAHKHSRVLCSVQGLAADVGCTVTLRDPKGPERASVLLLLASQWVK